MRYIKKAVEIEAKKLEWSIDSQKEIIDWINGNGGESRKGLDGGVIIHTLEGDMVANTGAYVIKGIQGEFYPCKSDIFEQTYTALG